MTELSAYLTGLVATTLFVVVIGSYYADRQILCFVIQCVRITMYGLAGMYAVCMKAVSNKPNFDSEG